MIVGEGGEGGVEGSDGGEDEDVSMTHGREDNISKSWGGDRVEWGSGWRGNLHWICMRGSDKHIEE